MTLVETSRKPSLLVSYLESYLMVEPRTALNVSKTATMLLRESQTGRVQPRKVHHFTKASIVGSVGLWPLAVIAVSNPAGGIYVFLL
jgi:hypothetical protein